MTVLKGETKHRQDYHIMCVRVIFSYTSTFRPLTAHTQHEGGSDALCLGNANYHENLHHSFWNPEIFYVVESPMGCLESLAGY